MIDPRLASLPPATGPQFSVGKKDVNDFRMIERHFFGQRLIKSFDFTFGFCIPSSVNTWESIYEVPGLDEDLIAEIVANPRAVKSDSFYFVDNVLVMHNKAEYTYTEKSEEKSASEPARPRADSKKGADDDVELERGEPEAKYEQKGSDFSY